MVARHLMRSLSWFGLGLFSSHLVAGAPPPHSSPSVTSSDAQRAFEIAASAAQIQRPSWHAQQAPGSQSKAAEDARQVWPALDGWVKVPLRSDGAPLAANVVTIPDDWGRGRERDYQAAWYILRVDLGEQLPPSLWVRFDAVAQVGDVFLNGSPVGHHLGGYTPFEIDLTQAARRGVNVLAVYVRDEHAVVDTKSERAVSQLGVDRPNEWLALAGIQEGVFFEQRAKNHLGRVVVRPSTRKDELEIIAKLHLASSQTPVQIRHQVFEWPAGTAPVLTFPEVVVESTQPIRATLPWRNPKRWSPAHPNLYVLRTTVVSPEGSESVETRFGFREFWIEGKQFVLNGQPIRLLGSSVARELEWVKVPEVGRRTGRAALEFLKREFNFNSIRLHNTIMPRQAAWAADEAGLLVINQTGLWSAMRRYYTAGANELLQNMDTQLEEWYWRDCNSPSVVIWDAENEMLRDERTPDAERWVMALDPLIKRFDPKLIVQHSGEAWFSDQQETIHLHMQERYASALRAWEETGKVPLICGEFWVGGRGGENRLTNSREYSSRDQWFQEENDLYRETILEMRYHGVSGVMPFWLEKSLLERTHRGIRRTFDPATDRVYGYAHPSVRNHAADALAPVLGIIWPRSSSVASGATLEKTITVCNDSEERRSLLVTAELNGERQSWPVEIPPGGRDRRQISFHPSASGTLHLNVEEGAGNRSTDTLSISLVQGAFAPLPQLTREIVVIPAAPSELADFLRELGVQFQSSPQLPADPARTLVVVPSGAVPDLLGRNPELCRDYLRRGGRLLVLRQADVPEWSPVNFAFWSAAKKSAPEFARLGWPEFTRDLIYSREIPIYAPGHPIFAGLSAEDLREWSEVDGRVSDDTFVRPSALDLQASGPYRVLAGCTRRENGAVVETRVGLGTALFCQAHVIEQRGNAGARQLFKNILTYLDGPGWLSTPTTVAVAGRIDLARLAASTRLPQQTFQPVSQLSTPRIVLAGDGADPATLERLVQAGSTVVVLSREVAARIPGYRVSSDESVRYFGTRSGVRDDPLFWGVASASFGPVASSPARGTLRTFPAQAQVLLGGLRLSASNLPKESSTGDRALELGEAADPIAVAESKDRGRLIVTTIEPWHAEIPAHAQFLQTLLANAGVDIPTEATHPAVLSVKRTVPLRLDGSLDDWTNDMEDPAVSLFQHASPLVLSRKDHTAGPLLSDLELSGILYLLHRDTQLYLGGIVFSDRTAPSCDFRLGEHLVQIDLAKRRVLIDGTEWPSAQLALGRQSARGLGDARKLSLMRRNPQIGSMHSASDTAGQTFEVSLPWQALGLKIAPRLLSGKFQLNGSNGTILRHPAGYDAGGASITLRFEE